MDYSKLSDFEINCSIAEMTGHKPLSEEQGYAGLQKGNITAAIVRGPSKIGGFDPCNDPADAWPIILSSRIGVVPGTATDKWAAHHGDWDVCIADENPLRAAMIVFLMMQESK